MIPCDNCGKPLVKGIQKCGYCNTTLSEEKKIALQNYTIEIRDDTKVIVIIGYSLMLLFSLPIAFLTLISFIVGYFICGPWASQIADDRNYDVNLAFVIGAWFGFLGLFAYWVIVKLISYRV